MDILIVFSFLFMLKCTISIKFDVRDVYFTILEHKCCTCATFLPAPFKNDATTTNSNTSINTHNFPLINYSLEINSNWLMVTWTCVTNIGCAWCIVSSLFDLVDLIMPLFHLLTRLFVLDSRSYHIQSKKPNSMTI